MKQRMHKWIVSHIKKQPLLKVPLLAFYTIFLTIYYIFSGLYQNKQRFAILGVSAIVFLGNTSFAFERNLGVEHAEIKSSDGFDEVDEEDIEGYEGDVFEDVAEDEKVYAEDVLDEAEVITETKAESKVSRSDWKLLLINKQHAIPENYEFTLGVIKGSMKCDERVIPYLHQMLKAAKEDDVNLVICSPYRDLYRQEALFNRKITNYMKKGMSYLDAYKTTAQAVTVPGASEHQVGLALDLVCDSYASLNEGFGETQAGKWLAKNSYKYGFILRYPKGKEYITGIEYEPWHFRYVGKEAAKEIMEQGLTLEEYVESLQYE